MVVDAVEGAVPPWLMGSPTVWIGGVVDEGSDGSRKIRGLRPAARFLMVKETGSMSMSRGGDVVEQEGRSRRRQSVSSPLDLVDEEVVVTTFMASMVARSL